MCKKSVLNITLFLYTVYRITVYYITSDLVPLSLKSDEWIPSKSRELCKYCFMPIVIWAHFGSSSCGRQQKSSFGEEELMIGEEDYKGPLELFNNKYFTCSDSITLVQFVSNFCSHNAYVKCASTKPFSGKTICCEELRGGQYINSDRLLEFCACNIP